MPVDRRIRRSLTDRLAVAISRTRAGAVAAAEIGRLRRRAVPNHWTQWFGIVPIALTAVLFVTGVILTVFYSASSDIVVYDGSYAPLHGVPVSKAFDSVMNISFEVRGGLLVRQAHHWAALALPASIAVQLAILFFTGGYRRPRRGSWLLLMLVLLVALGTGWTGYALPDDLLAGTGLRITQGVALGIPVVGAWISQLIFGGPFPGSPIEQLAPLHIVVLPLVLIALIGIRALVVLQQPAARFPVAATRREPVIPSWPNGATRAAGLSAIVAGLIVVIAATVTVSPVWLNGPSDPGNVGAGSQPDWYTGFLDGALRLVPPGWEVEWLGYTWTFAILIPLAVVTLFIAAVAIHPFLESWITTDKVEHELLDRPRNAENRTALGVAGLVFIGTLWGAGAADHIAVLFRLSLEGVLIGFQVLLIAGPIAAFVLARRFCLALQDKDRDIVQHGWETGNIVRLPGGEYAEVHAGGGEQEQWRLPVGHTSTAALVSPSETPQPGGAGRETARKVNS
jgi:ubiquinol-cytochrome c reductase cytochrome b subunit